MKRNNAGLESLVENVLKNLEESFAEAQKYPNSRGCASFGTACKKRLLDYANNGQPCGISCEYCNHFIWVIDRAKHYADTLGLDWKDILAHWEENRDYWWLNYYQECMRPKLDGSVKVFDTIEEFKQSVGDKGFRCPHCRGVSEHPTCCTAKLEVDGKECDWKAYGFLRTLGKGVNVFIKEVFAQQEIFMPVAWEHKDE